ncbi:MAG: hypothetical protein ACJ72E_03205 [Marmoricola sp.]
MSKRTSARPVLPPGEEEVGHSFSDGDDPTISKERRVSEDPPHDKAMEDDPRWAVRTLRIGQ